jgi:hypothetical protein
MWENLENFIWLYIPPIDVSQSCLYFFCLLASKQSRFLSVFARLTGGTPPLCLHEQRDQRPPYNPFLPCALANGQCVHCHLRLALVCQVKAVASFWGKIVCLSAGACICGSAHRYAAVDAACGAVLGACCPCSVRSLGLGSSLWALHG